MKSSSQFRTQSAATEPLRFTPMQIGDLDAVDELEQRCFSMPWPTSAYRRELTRNRHAAYWVVRPALTAAATFGLPQIMAYGGYWLMGDEAHIATIAAHPEWRRCHLGEWTLLQMLAHARRGGAAEATLEVRVGNSSAIRLYHKLGFQQVGRRKRYYSDTGEDALLYTLDGLSDPGGIWQTLNARRVQIADGFRRRFGLTRVNKSQPK